MHTIVKKHGIIVLLLISLFAGCKNQPNNTGDDKVTKPSTQEQSSEPVYRPPVSTESYSQSVDLEAKIGQMLIVGFRGLSIKDKGVQNLRKDIQEYHLGGVILFDYDMTRKSWKRNIKSPTQVRTLVEQLQVVSQIPLFITVDQEGGNIQRLKKKFGFPTTASAQYLGQQNNLALTNKQASKIAKMLAGLGINFNFAPVVDLNLNPNNPVIGGLERSFSAKPDIVTQHALQFIEAHRRYGVLCAIKHFPGHGSSSRDSHLGSVDVTNTWKEMELEPYQRIIDEGMADAVMTAHIFNKRLDSEHPATLSNRIVTGKLRQELRYDGVVVSDDMQMGAITNNYDFERAIQIALEAGIDLIVIGNNLKYEKDIIKRTVAVIKQLVEEGKIPAAHIDESYQRIQQLKSRLPKRYALTVEAEPSDSRIRIMKYLEPKYSPGSDVKQEHYQGYGPKYFHGIKLKPGSYDIWIDKKGYHSKKQWVTIRNQDTTKMVNLEKK